ncbi:MAG: hypothetical protein FJ095_14020 [Deltaproteobacteria bacterium]|nr:hypothetical protein [Deltaproteobacteria bacterium]
MRSRRGGVLLFGLAALAGYAGCSAASKDSSAAATSGSGANGGAVTSAGTGSLDAAQSGAGGYEGCAKFSATADLAPAAMLVVLDRSASMSQLNKWGAAQLALVQAIDKDVFDTMSLGMSTFPSGYTGAPDCLCPGWGPTCFGLLPKGVACGFPTLPQVAIAPAGANKSNGPSGVRNAIYQFLTANTPEVADPSDASPIYDSLAGAYLALRSTPIEKRIAVLITDGGFSCTSLSGRPGYSDGQCLDWEFPDTVNALITEARTDKDKPILTFIVGVPGSDSTGQKQGPYATAPYSMKLALSTYAVAGSPDTVPADCDKAAIFTQGGSAPAKACHLDLTGGYDVDALANAIAKIRGAAVGCVYPLPAAPPGEEIDLDKVNVVVTLEGKKQDILRRADMADPCTVDGCWDYDATGNVELIGKACADVNAATKVDVEVFFGCASKIK